MKTLTATVVQFIKATDYRFFLINELSTMHGRLAKKTEKQSTTIVLNQQNNFTEISKFLREALSLPKYANLIQ